MAANMTEEIKLSFHNKLLASCVY